jgi:uncharacterized damage-inducible protein DinB
MADELEAQPVEAWRTNQRMLVGLIDAIDDEGMRATLSKRGGRGVAGELAHIHNVRVYHIEKRAPDLAKGLATFPTKTEPTKAELKTALGASADAVERLLVGSFRGEKKRRGFRRGVFTTLAYFISHESHHRGRILLTLKVSGHTLDKAAQYRLWAWDQA